MTWLRSDGDSVVLSLHIQPGAKKTQVAGLHGAALKIRLSAPPVDGKANDALIGFLAESLGVARGCVELVSGASSRAKRVRVTGVAAATVALRLLPNPE
ncbi:MAG: DUF167 family protein [Sterolibacterium sp.]